MYITPPTVVAKDPSEPEAMDFDLPNELNASETKS